MVVTCCVYGCAAPYKTNESISLFRIPAVGRKYGPEDQQLQRKRRRAWATVLEREFLEDEKLSNLRVCDKHFVSGKCSYEIYNNDFEVETLNLKTIR